MGGNSSSKSVQVAALNAISHGSDNKKLLEMSGALPLDSKVKQCSLVQN